MTDDSASSTAVDDRDGEVLAGRYRIDALIGRGGMSSVYRSFDASLGRIVTLKVFSPELASAEDISRQREEIRMLASLSHPSLVTLFDAVAGEDGRVFLVLEYVEGSDLRDVLTRTRPNSATLSAIGADVADALTYIHARGVVHRDVKPGNILVASPSASSHFTAKLADFGIARLVDATRLTMTGSVLGTASYLSPEQAKGEAVGSPSDIYSLGLVLLECATGEKAFDGTGIETAVARLTRDPRMPSTLGPEWARLIAAMTRRDPADRPSALNVATTLRELTDAPLEDLAPTLRFPAASGDDDANSAMDAATVALTTPMPATPVDQSRPPSDARATPDRPVVTARRLRRQSMVIAFSAAAIVFATAVAITIGMNASPTDSSAVDAPTPDYPIVEGTLGEHLTQLQESVAP